MPRKQTSSLATQAAIPVERIAQKIYLIRGQKVMLDSDLAELYEVETKVLNQAVRRNIERFPEDFMFQLVPEELENLRSQFVTSSSGYGVGAICLTLLPSKAWQCFPAFCEASARSKSTSQLCGRS
jgi:hypothetical protein